MLLLQLLLPLQDMLVVFVCFFIHKADVSSTGIDLHASVQTLLLLLSLLLLLPLWFLPSFLIVVLLLQLLSTNTVVNQFEHLRRFFFSHLFSLLSSRFSRCFSTRESANPVAAQLRHRWRATLPRPKATLRSSSRRVFSHRNASASNKCKPCCSAVVASLLQTCCLICTSGLL